MENVQVIHTQDGRLQRLAFEDRKVYRSTKGRFIKTRSHGRVYLDEHNVARIAYERKVTPRGTVVNKKV